jgi:DNA mismatch repair protein MutL
VRDLETIATLGFRGEALASIASVSRTTIVTRHAEEAMGTRMYIEGGGIKHKEMTGAAKGTVISVENLFYNVPARLKFLKRDATERGHIGALITRYAMAYPDVRFRFLHGNQELMRTTGSGSLLDVINEVYGLDIAEQMLAVDSVGARTRDDLPAITVQGFAGDPALTRSNRQQITLFVNGRWVQDSSLSYAVVQAYHTMLMTGRYPVVVLMLEVPPEQVDVNVHPTKAEVRFRRPDAAFSAVQRAVRSALVEGASAPTERPDIRWGSPQWAARRDRLTQVTAKRLDQLGLDLEGDDSGRYRHQNPDESDYGITNNAPPPRKRKLPMMRVVGQVGGTYIVAEGPDGMYLVDQHAAHERILYEEFMAERQEQPAPAQELLEAVVVDLLPEQAALVEDSLDALEQVGFRVEVFGRNAVRLRAIPALVADSDPVEALMAAIGDIECGEMPTEATAEQKLIARVCKRAAIKAGQVLGYAEMQGIIRQLEECDAPKTCPHGRPTILHLSAQQIAKEFGRLGAL